MPNMFSVATTPCCRIFNFSISPHITRHKGAISGWVFNTTPQPFNRREVSSILHSECGGTRWRTGGEVKGKLANGVGSQYSHTTSDRSVSSITNANAHTSATSSRLNWLPRRHKFKWTRPFRRKTKCGFCACAIRFRTSSTNRTGGCACFDTVWTGMVCDGYTLL